MDLKKTLNYIYNSELTNAGKDFWNMEYIGQYF